MQLTYPDDLVRLHSPSLHHRQVQGEMAARLLSLQVSSSPSPYTCMTHALIYTHAYIYVHLHRYIHKRKDIFTHIPLTLSTETIPSLSWGQLRYCGPSVQCVPSSALLLQRQALTLARSMTADTWNVLSGQELLQPHPTVTCCRCGDPCFSL